MPITSLKQVLFSLCLFLAGHALLACRAENGAPAERATPAAAAPAPAGSAVADLVLDRTP